MIKIIIRRFLELILTCGIISALAVTLNVLGVFTTRITVFLISFIGAVIFFYLDVSMLRHCFFDLRDRKAYYIANFAAYALFGLCTVVVYLCFSSAVYGWIFAITKFFKYTNLSFSTVASTAVFHLIGGLIILLAPIGMKWVFLPEVIDQEEQ